MSEPDEVAPERESPAIFSQDQAKALASMWQRATGAGSLLQGAMLAIRYKLKAPSMQPEAAAGQTEKEKLDEAFAAAISHAARSQWGEDFLSAETSEEEARMMVKVWEIEFSVSAEQAAISAISWGLKLPPYDKERFNLAVEAEEKAEAGAGEALVEKKLMDEAMATVNKLWPARAKPGGAGAADAAGGASGSGKVALAAASPGGGGGGAGDEGLNAAFFKMTHEEKMRTMAAAAM